MKTYEVLYNSSATVRENRKIHYSCYFVVCKSTTALTLNDGKSIHGEPPEQYDDDDVLVWEVFHVLRVKIQEELLLR